MVTLNGHMQISCCNQRMHLYVTIILEVIDDILMLPSYPVSWVYGTKILIEGALLKLNSNVQ